jgi:ribosomal protein S19E (S16A)
MGGFCETTVERVIKIQMEGEATPAQTDDWIAARIAQAKKKSRIADFVALEIKNQLNGIMCERPLRPAELGVLAKKLLEATDDPPADEVVK